MKRMENELTKKAVKMLLNGATLLSEPCPYCKGVRVMKEGHALCISCGKEPEKREIENKQQPPTRMIPIKETLEKKIEKLSKDIDKESDLKKQQEILKTIDSLLETVKKIEKQQ